ncbi:MAG: DUF4255 domain-containing protein [Acidobacteriota bacterium]
MSTNYLSDSFYQTMINDLSLTLRELVNQDTMLKDVQILFDRPSEKFNPTALTLNLFLYDIRENRELRTSESISERRDNSYEIYHPPLRVDCSYLITAWPGSLNGDEAILQEQQLLSRAIIVLAKYTSIPDSFLQGSLTTHDRPITIRMLQSSEIKDPADFWSAIGNKLRPSLNFVVTLAMPSIVEKESAPVVTSLQVHINNKELSNLQ